VKILAVFVLSAVVSATALVATQAKTVRVRVQTELGDIVLEVDPVKAPITTANFLKYVDAGHYDGGVFHRTVKMDNQPESTVKIEVIQAGVNPERAKEGFPAIALERTSVTGILHKDAVVSMAHQRSAVARLWRQPQSRRPGFRRLWTRRGRDGRGAEDPGRAVIDQPHDQHRGPTTDPAHQDRQGGSRALGRWYYLPESCR
jgi:hypothetical protein